MKRASTIAAILTLALFAGVSVAAWRTRTSNGLWGDANMWEGGNIPGNGDDANLVTFTVLADANRIPYAGDLAGLHATTTGTLTFDLAALGSSGAFVGSPKVGTGYLVQTTGDANTSTFYLNGVSIVSIGGATGLYYHNSTASLEANFSTSIAIGAVAVSKAIRVNTPAWTMRLYSPWISGGSATGTPVVYYAVGSRPVYIEGNLASGSGNGSHAFDGVGVYFGQITLAKGRQFVGVGGEVINSLKTPIWITRPDDFISWTSADPNFNRKLVLQLDPNDVRQGVVNGDSTGTLVEGVDANDYTLLDPNSAARDANWYYAGVNRIGVYGSDPNTFQRHVWWGGSAGVPQSLIADGACWTWPDANGSATTFRPRDILHFNNRSLSVLTAPAALTDVGGIVVDEYPGNVDCILIAVENMNVLGPVSIVNPKAFVGDASDQLILEGSTFNDLVNVVNVSTTGGIYRKPAKFTFTDGRYLGYEITENQCALRFDANATVHALAPVKASITRDDANMWGDVYVHLLTADANFTNVADANNHLTVHYVTDPRGVLDVSRITLDGNLVLNGTNRQGTLPVVDANFVDQAQGGTAVFPSPGDVTTGVQYGPGGDANTGSKAAGTGVPQFTPLSIGFLPVTVMLGFAVLYLAGMAARWAKHRRQRVS